MLPPASLLTGIGAPLAAVAVLLIARAILRTGPLLGASLIACPALLARLRLAAVGLALLVALLRCALFAVARLRFLLRLRARVVGSRRSRLRLAPVATACLTVGLAAGLALGVGLGLSPGASAAPADPYPANLATYYSQTPAWTSCGTTSSSGTASAREQCAWITVPLDYADPTGATIRLRLAKWPATGSTKLGSLVVNPGGPGASGIDFGEYVATSAPGIAAAYDVVGFDPRGVGSSAPITCLTGPQTTTFLRTESTPTTARQEQAYLKVSQGLAKGCLSLSPGLARNVGTDNTVQDMDIIRAALGDKVLNWLGASYGTYLGTRYIEQYPSRVGRMVLDGVVDPSLDAMALSYGQSLAFQRALTRFAADCARHHTCPYPGGADGVIKGINALLAQLDTHPMRTSGRLPLIQNEATTAVIQAMYAPFLWPTLRKGLSQARSGDGTGLQRLAAFASDQTSPDTYASNMASAFPAIGCWDEPAPPGATGLKAAAAEWSAKATVPEIARTLAWGNLPCAVWFGHSPVAPAPAQSTTTAPILLVGTTYDPATPYWWAQALHQQLPTSTLLTFEGDGHTAFGNGSACIDRAITAYLVQGALPAPNTVCR